DEQGKNITERRTRQKPSPLLSLIGMLDDRFSVLRDRERLAVGSTELDEVAPVVLRAVDHHAVTRCGSSVADLTRCSRSRTPCQETDWVGKSRRARAPFGSID